MKAYLLTLLLLLSSVSLSAQWKNTKLSEEEKRAEYREKIGIDMSVPDFDIKKIDAKVMGSHLANILTFLMNNYQQGFYISQLKDIASEQNNALEHVYLEIKKLSFVYAVKKGDELAIMVTLQTCPLSYLLFDASHYKLYPHTRYKFLNRVELMNVKTYHA